MKKFNLIYLHAVFVLKMWSVEWGNAWVGRLLKSKHFRFKGLIIRSEEKLLQKRQYMNTAMKNYVIAKINMDSEKSRKYILNLAGMDIKSAI